MFVTNFASGASSVICRQDSSDNGGPNYEGELSINNKDKSLALIVKGKYGPNQIGHSNSNRGAIDPIVAIKPAFLPNTTFVTEYLYGSETGHVSNNHSATWQGISQYFVYDLDVWEFATRGELFDDQDGSRTGLHQTLWEITQTLTYKSARLHRIAGPCRIPP